MRIFSIPAAVIAVIYVASPLAKATPAAFDSVPSSTPRIPGQCADFADLAPNGAFCRNVEWMRNRGITQGCRSGSYCPATPLSRIGLAAFMNRVGGVLAPSVVSQQGIVDLGDFSAWGCHTEKITAKGYPRRIHIDGRFSFTASSDTPVTYWIARLDYDVPPPGNGFQTLSAGHGFVPANQWANARFQAHYDLHAGDAAWFVVGLAESAGAITLTSADCNLRVRIDP